MTAQNGARPLVLVQMDGWGIRAAREGNAIATAKTRILDRIAASSPQISLAASGAALGLAEGRPGHAAAAYATLGAGRPAASILAGITRHFQSEGADGIAANPVLQRLMSRVRPIGGTVHLFGVMSSSGIAGQKHLLAVLAALLSHEGVNVRIHAIMDGQDAGSRSGIDHLAEFLDDIAGAENAALGTVFGRALGFDDLSDPAALAASFRAILHADAPAIEYPVAYLDECYRKKIDDDRIPPAIHPSYRGIRQDDALFFVNLQPEHGQRLFSALLSPAASGLADRLPALSGAFSLLPPLAPLSSRVEALFTLPGFSGSFSETVSGHSLSQITLTESAVEPLAWFHARGGASSLFAGETVLVTETPALKQLEKKPDHTLSAITSEVLSALKNNEHHLITAHFAAPALLARTGNMKATVSAIEAVDACLGKIAAQIEKRGGTLAICGTYGKAEQMLDPETGAPWRGTTTAPVPFILMNGPKALAPRDGTLADVAPTLLHLLGLDVPSGMSGRNLLLPAEDRIGA